MIMATYLIAQSEIDEGLILERCSDNVGHHRACQQVGLDVECEKMLVLLKHGHDGLKEDKNNNID
jgi:hypothetical protein